MKKLKKNSNNFLKSLMTLTIFLISCNLFAQTNRYVNDIYNPLTDIYTFSTGSDSNPGTPLLPYATINYAISQSAAGDTIYVDAGNYTEQVEINKDLILIGAGAGSTTVISPVTLPLFFTTSADWHPVIYAHDAANIVVKNLTVDGAGRGNANLRFVGVGYFQAGGSIEDLEIKAVRNTPIDGAQGGTGIVIYSNTGTARTVNVKGNNVYDYQKNGMAMSGSILTVFVDSNIVTGSGPINIIGQNGVQLSGGATGSITNNTISGVSYTPATTVACGVLVFAASGLVITSGNTVNNVQAGIYYYQSSGLINTNVVSNNAANMGATPYWYGIDVQNGTTTVSQNTVNGGGNGVGIQADAVTGLDVSRIEADAVSENNSRIEADARGQITIMNAINNFVDSTDEGFVTRTAGTGAVDISIVHNSITNIIRYAIHNYGATTQTDTCNWYGTNDANFIATNKISGPVIFIPYLTDGTDVEPATPGFQPCPDCCDGPICPDTIAPVFNPPTPTCQDVIIIQDTGVAITFTVQIKDNFADSITLDVDSLPPGATMTPPLPTSGNPVSSVFTWTPTSYGFQQVTFTATDSCGNQTSCQIIFDVALPVELTSFTSLINNNQVTLKWSTATESNNSRFEIERANGNSQEWNKVGTIQGNGNSTQPISYSFVNRGLNVGSYSYRLKQIDFNGNFTYHNLSNEVIIGVPTRFNLSQNYPNPFNPSTKIDYDLPYDSKVELKIFDISGREVAIIINEFRQAGYYTELFNATNLSSGIYFYRIKAGEVIQSKRMILVK